jgi:ketosteroid isomerase-like protein
MTDINHQADQEIRKLAHEWLDAVRLRDGLTLDRILANDFVISGWQPDGQVACKQFYIEDCLKPVTVEHGSYRFEQWQTRVYDDVAIVNCVLEVHALIDGHQWGGKFTITDVWMKECDAWKVVTRHTSPIFTTKKEEVQSPG